MGLEIEVGAVGVCRKGAETPFFWVLTCKVKSRGALKLLSHPGTPAFPSFCHFMSITVLPVMQILQRADEAVLVQDNS